jgi:hypothetical protein
MAGVHMKQIRKVLDGLKGSNAVQWQGYLIAVTKRVAVHKPLAFPNVEVLITKPMPPHILPNGDVVESGDVTWSGTMRDAAKVLFFNLNRKDT